MKGLALRIERIQSFERIDFFSGFKRIGKRIDPLEKYEAFYW